MLIKFRLLPDYLKISGTNEEKLNSIKMLLGSSEQGKKGIEELEFILNYITEPNGKAKRIDCH